jgi:hypothetical protein
MGIEVEMTWKGETEEERKEKELSMARSIDELVEAWTAGRRNVPGVGRTALGHVGYLYEAYHGGPYATPILVPEAFEAADHAAKVPAAAMRSRLAASMAAARLRAREVFDDETGALGDAMAKSLADFVALAERKEGETGEPVTVTASP